MAKEEKSVIEQALLEAEQIDATFKANAKEILTQVMGSEIEEMVKESLGGSPMASNEEEDDDLDLATDLEMGSDDDELDLEMGNDEDDLDLDLGDGLEDDMDVDLDTIDLTGADDSELISVFKKMGPEDEIEVVQDENGVSFTDLESGAEYKVELGGSMNSEDEYEEDEYEDEEGMELGDEDEVEIDLDGGDSLDLELGDGDIDDEEESEVVYEIVMDEEDIDEVEEGGDSMKEAPRTMSKLKGRKYGNPKPRQESKRPVNGKLVKENKVLKTNIKSIKSENQELKENQEKMVDALKQFRQKLQEVAVFNSNLAHVVRLFTENTTTKEEKVDIVKRMDEAKTLKESKLMFKNITKGLEGVTKKPIQESINDKVNKTASTGSSQITESKVYENPELAKMKKMWEFDYKY